MRLIDLAHELGVTRQVLKRELEKINFGIDPNAKEVSDGMAVGIIRVLTPKFTKEISEKKKRDAERMRALELEKQSEDSVEKKDPEIQGSIVDRSAPRVFSVVQQFEEKKAKIAEEDAKKREDREKNAKKNNEESSSTQSSPPPRRWDRKNTEKTSYNQDDLVPVTRKIDISEHTPSSQKKHKKKGARQEHVQKAHKRMRMNEVPEEQQEVMSFAEQTLKRRLEDEVFKASQAKRRKKLQNMKKIEDAMVKKEGVIEIPGIISVKEFAEKTGVPVSKLIAVLLKNGAIANVNTAIDFDTWALIALEVEVSLKKQTEEHSVEDVLSGNLQKLMSDDTENLESRAPVIVVMGHVDHGKTSILDYYRHSNVVSKESGGITQHIGAYQVEVREKKITFLDTPGHEAFTAMRARGAKLTDIAILVVAADEGVKPQTQEAYNHAKEAGVPIIVAMNKIDKPNADVMRVKGDLMSLGLVPEDFGGDVMVVPMSAKTGEGMEDLLDAILLHAEVLDLKANPKREAIATVVESHLEKSLGSVATMVINTGTLRIGDTVIAGSVVGKIRTLTDGYGISQRSVGPSGVAKVSGFESVPETGVIVQVVKNDKEARERADQVKNLQQKDSSGNAMADLMLQLQSGKLQNIKVIIKGDSQGSIEAISSGLEKIQKDGVSVKVIHSGVGAITESDIMMAMASKAIIIGFHIAVSSRLVLLAEKEGVELRSYDVIYHLFEDMEKIITGIASDEIVEIEIGRARVKALFMSSKVKQIVGLQVLSGKIVKDGFVEVYREEEKIFQAPIANLRSYDKDVKEVLADNECGLQFSKPYEIIEGDIFVCKKKDSKFKLGIL